MGEKGRREGTRARKERKGRRKREGGREGLYITNKEKPQTESYI